MLLRDWNAVRWSCWTQNVDGLHESAGSTRTIDLHGRADRVRCLTCGLLESRSQLQHRLAEMNADAPAHHGRAAPDGDVELSREATADFRVASCRHCDGILKPDVVFFGESVPRDRVDAAMAAVGRAGAMLVVGSSLAVWSGYRFAVEANRLGKPIIAINEGWTRADEILHAKLESKCGAALPVIVEELLERS